MDENDSRDRTTTNASMDEGDAIATVHGNMSEMEYGILLSSSPSPLVVLPPRRMRAIPTNNSTTTNIDRTAYFVATSIINRNSQAHTDPAALAEARTTKLTTPINPVTTNVSPINAIIAISVIGAASGTASDEVDIDDDARSENRRFATSRQK
jgi:hypothetical protein